MPTSMYGAGAEYALHSLLVLASQTDPLSIRDLAGYQRIPERYLAKIFFRLKNAGLILGLEGIHGGFVLGRPAAQIRVIDVLEAVDPGNKVFKCAEIRRNCALFGETAPQWAVSGPCRIHAFFEDAEQRLFDFLASKPLADLHGEFKCKAPDLFVAETESWFKDRRQSRSGNRTAGV